MLWVEIFWTNIDWDLNTTLNRSIELSYICTIYEVYVISALPISPHTLHFSTDSLDFQLSETCSSLPENLLSTLESPFYVTEYIRSAGELIPLPPPSTSPTMETVGVTYSAPLKCDVSGAWPTLAARIFLSEIQFQLPTVVIGLHENADFTDCFPFLVSLPYPPASGFLSSQINLYSDPCLWICPNQRW